MQEPGAGSVITYPRNLEGIVRKTDTRRRSAREARAERKAAEAAALEAEVKRRKAEKRRELQHRCVAANFPCMCGPKLQVTPCMVFPRLYGVLVTGCFTGGHAAAEAAALEAKHRRREALRAPAALGSIITCLGSRSSDAVPIGRACECKMRRGSLSATIT